MLSANITRVADSLKTGRISAVELCELCLQRMNRVKRLNAFITELPDLSRLTASQAHRSIQQQVGGPLEGIPVAVKDNFCTAGIQTSCASRMLTGYVPPYTATVVNKLQKAGAVLVGKTNLDEFAMGCGSVDGSFGPVRNPWKYDFLPKPEEDSNRKPSTIADGGVSSDSYEKNVNDFHISGGSSGGSAVAVATGSVFAALGSDTGGSTRNPASYCGVVGFKPTYGLLSRHGLIPLVNSMDVPGVLTRCVDDTSLVLNILAGHDQLDSTTVSQPFTSFSLPEQPSIKGLKVGIPMEYHAPGLSLETVTAWQWLADMLENNGASVVRVSLPHTQLAIVCYHVLCACEVASNMARYDGLQYGHRAGVDSSTEALYAATRHEGFNEVVRGRILAGNYFLLKQNYERYYVRAQKLRRLITDDFVNVFGMGKVEDLMRRGGATGSEGAPEVEGVMEGGGVDVLLTPTVLGDAPLYSVFSTSDNRTRTQEQDVFTQPANLAGVPAISVPVTLSSNGLPIGLQLIGRPFEERRLLLVAKAVEQLVNFRLLDLESIL